MVECKGLSTGYPGAAVSENMDLFVSEGEILTIIGPNGCGKTTLLKTISGLIPPQGGEVLLMGKSLTEYTERLLARRRAYLPQLRETPDILVSALVSHGRFPYLGFSRQMTARDREVAEMAMEMTGVLHLRHKKMGQLSGGQRQRVYLAMTVAQETPLLLWDEPTTYLDINSRLNIMELVKTLNQQGKTIIMTLQDLSDALTVSHRVCLIDEKGAVVMAAPPEQVFQSGEIDRVFGVHSERVQLASGEASYVFTLRKGIPVRGGEIG